ncbi:hypothetical protein [Pseudomonas serbica]|uniref:hypothetical protein n=1 Tax=Pseudomonas serbica TaxID=2965074 RepID=UPI00237A590E|nr:hypothetical protein [Pseudomonas serbica]
MTDKLEVTRVIAEYALNKMEWDASPKWRDMAKDLRKLLAEPPAVKAEPPEMAALRAELERIRGLNHFQILAEAAGRHLVDSGAENYVGHVFTISLDDGTAQFEVVVTTQKVGAKSPHDRLVACEQRNAELIEVLKGLPEGFKDLSGGEHSAGVTACIEYTEQCIFKALKTSEPEENNECSNCNGSQVATTFDGDGVPRDGECLECKNDH